MPPLIVDRISKTFTRADGYRTAAARQVSLEVREGEAFGLIGESGSGKSTIARLVLGLMKPDSGRILFEGTDIAKMTPRALRQARSRLQVVFQEPFESLNPAMRAGAIVEEPLIIHHGSLSRQERRRRVIETLEHVGLSEAFWNRYPSQLSGGQQQRVGIARAIVTRPSLVVLDEPISSLDLSAQAVILNLLKSLQKDLHLSYLFISHDIATVRHFCSRLAVIYRGHIVESGSASKILGAPRHPYTRALLSAALSVDPMEKAPHYPLRDELAPHPAAFTGCPLLGRCPIEIPELCSLPIPTTEVEDGHFVACIRADRSAGDHPPENGRVPNSWPRADRLPGGREGLLNALARPNGEPRDAPEARHGRDVIRSLGVRAPGA
jgi:oligopeptide/dipeptide ABC transporter ATP-binding protein